eukprot:1761438-Heterocapsa_arctica.AAC.1
MISWLFGGDEDAAASPLLPIVCFKVVELELDVDVGGWQGEVGLDVEPKFVWRTALELADCACHGIDGLNIMRPHCSISLAPA